MEETIKAIMQKALVKLVSIYDIEDEKHIVDIETNFIIQENMVLKFTKIIKGIGILGDTYKTYKTIVRRIELEASMNLHGFNGNETLECYVEVIEVN